MNTYIAVIGDMKSSKDLQKRRLLSQEMLTSALSTINDRYAQYIASKFVITLGDEFQGLLSQIDPIFDIIEDIYFTMTPYVEFRYGIGVGSILTKINPEAALGADGPAYHQARSMITVIKNQERMYKQAESLYGFSGDFPQEYLDVINNQLSLISLIQSTWTEKQKESIKTYRQNPDNREYTAKLLGISQSSLQRRLKYATYYHYMNTKETLLNFLTYTGVPHA